MTPTDTPAEIEGVCDALDAVRHDICISSPCPSCDSEALLTIQLQAWEFITPARALAYAKLLRAVEKAVRAIDTHREVYGPEKAQYILDEDGDIP